MQKLSLDALARELLHRAEQSNTGRSAHTVFGGHEHIMRQTMVALTAGTTLAEHESPGEATVVVLSGRVQLPPERIAGKVVTATSSSSRRPGIACMPSKTP
jgi:quercetin dioxygenase-like cupin family protein